MSQSQVSKAEISPATAKALERFAKGPDVTARAVAITELLAQKSLARVLGADEFRVGLAGLHANLSPDNTPETRLAALAQLMRMAQSAKGLSKEITKLVVPSLVKELPPVSLLKEADDRGYVAKACGLCKEEWVLGYAFRAIAEEETGEKPRAEFIRIAFDRAKSLEKG